MRLRHLATHLRPLGSKEDGAALPIVVLGIVVIALLTFLVQQLAISQTTQSNFYASEDTVLAAGEAMLERYATKLSIDPIYYQSYVDEAEAPRRCSDIRSLSYGSVAMPGSPWFDDCWDWAYEYTNTYYEHPLLLGEAGEFDDVGVLLHVTPPTGAGRLGVELVAKQADRPAQRALQAEIGPESVSEFVWMVEGDLFFGPEDKTYGKVYSGNNVGYETGGEAHGDVFAEGAIVLDLKIKSKTYHPPIWMNGAQGWDSTGNFNSLGEVITDVYPDPVDFASFFDDLDLLARAACSGGICLDPAANPLIPSDVIAYLVETTAGGTKLQISYATETPHDSSCNTSLGETKDHLARWTQASQNADWTLLGVYDIPRNGALWANQNVVVGRNEATPFVLDGALTIYTGSSSDRNDIIFGSDVLYANGLNGDDLVALIASGQMWINPNSLGSDNAIEIYGSLLNQDGELHIALRCLDNGSCRTPDGATITTYGSIAASDGAGNLTACLAADYNFDERLERLRPPFFPIMNDDWNFTNWEEIPEPCWVESGGCP